MKGDLRCIEGRLFRHDPQYDDPDLETDVGKCPDCDGEGCNNPCENCGRAMQKGWCSSCDDDRAEGEEFVAEHGMPFEAVKCKK